MHTKQFFCFRHIRIHTECYQSFDKQHNFPLCQTMEFQISIYNVAYFVVNTSRLSNVYVILWMLFIFAASSACIQTFYLRPYFPHIDVDRIMCRSSSGKHTNTNTSQNCAKTILSYRCSRVRIKFLIKWDLVFFLLICTCFLSFFLSFCSISQKTVLFNQSSTFFWAVILKV